jgi:hypothetical protein
VIVDRAGTRLEFPYEVSLWEAEEADGRLRSIVAPIDPATIDIDPLMLL